MLEQGRCAVLGMKPPGSPRWWSHPEEEDETWVLREEDVADDAELEMRAGVSLDQPQLDEEPADEDVPLNSDDLPRTPRAQPRDSAPEARAREHARGPSDVDAAPRTEGTGSASAPSCAATDEPALTESAVRARGESRAILDRAEADAEDLPTSISAQVTVPGGRRAHKQTIMTELNVMTPGQDLSADRLARISKAVADLSQSAQARAAPVANEIEPMFGIGVDFAMAFEEEDGSVKALFGRVERMKGRSGKGGRLQIWRQSFVLSAIMPDVHVFATWYSRVPGEPRTFKYDVLDALPYSLIHVLAIVDLIRDEATDTYTLDEETNAGIEAAVIALQRSRAVDASAARVARTTQQAATALEARRSMQGATTYVQGGQTRSGRNTTKRAT